MESFLPGHAVCLCGHDKSDHIDGDRCNYCECFIFSSHDELRRRMKQALIFQVGWKNVIKEILNEEE